MFKEKEKVKSTLSEEVETINTKEEYEETQKKELKSILESMSGVGKVQVMINFKSGESKVLAYDSSKQIVSTEEKDTEGGTRVSNQTNDGTTVVMTNEGGDNEPFIVETYKPKIEGIMILAEGASDSKIKYDIQKAVSSLYGLSAEKVNVYPMK